MTCMGPLAFAVETVEASKELSRQMILSMSRGGMEWCEPHFALETRYLLSTSSFTLTSGKTWWKTFLSSSRSRT